MVAVEITKASGEKESFSKTKFCRSLRSAGAPRQLADEICSLIEREVTPGMTTSQIFRKASRYLTARTVSVGARYSLKRGIAELGPAGFLFEQFVEVLLQSLGYTTERNQIVRGQCISHEVDVVAHNGEQHFLIEAKYRNKSWIKTHTDVVMYADARLQDIVRREQMEHQKHHLHRMWIFTNTKFTENAIAYGDCRGLGLTGWSYPSRDSLEDIITRNALYPVTVLPSVDRATREQFAKRNMMLARDLAPYSPSDLVEDFGVAEPRARRIIREAYALVYGE